MTWDEGQKESHRLAQSGGAARCLPCRSQDESSLGVWSGCLENQELTLQNKQGGRAMGEQQRAAPAHLASPRLLRASLPAILLT